MLQVFLKNLPNLLNMTFLLAYNINNEKTLDKVQILLWRNPPFVKWRKKEEKKKGKEKNKEKAQPGAVEIHGTATAPLI